MTDFVRLGQTAAARDLSRLAAISARVEAELHLLAAEARADVARNDEAIRRLGAGLTGDRR